MGALKGSSILCSLQNRDSHFCLQSESSHIQKDPDSRASEGDRSESEGEWSEVEEVRLEGLGSPPPHLPESQSEERDPSQVRDFIGGVSCLGPINLLAG